MNPLFASLLIGRRCAYIYQSREVLTKMYVPLNYTLQENITTFNVNLNIFYPNISVIFIITNR